MKVIKPYTVVGFMNSGWFIICMRPKIAMFNYLCPLTIREAGLKGAACCKDHRDMQPLGPDPVLGVYFFHSYIYRYDFMSLDTPNLPKYLSDHHFLFRTKLY